LPVREAKAAMTFSCSARKGATVMYEERGTRGRASEILAGAGVMTRRGFVRMVTFAGGAVAAVGPAALARREVSAQDQITLKHWYHQYGEEGTQEAAFRYAEQFTEAHPSIAVEVTWVPGDYGTTLNSALLTDEGPDVYETDPTVAMVKEGQCAPLDELFTEEVKADFHPNNIARVTIDGQIYGIKKIDDMGMIYYRKSILESAGVAPPTTMDEVIAAAQALDTGRQKGLFLGNDGGIAALLTIAPWSAGSDFLDPATGQITFNNERTVLAYQKVKELNDSGALLIGAPTDWWDPSAFNDGLAAMQWTGLWAMPGIQAAIGDDFGVLPWPALDAEGTPATFWGGWNELVNGKTQYLAEAKQLAGWLWIENLEIQKDWALSYGFHVPPRQSAAATAEPLQSPPASEAVTFLNDHGRILPPQWTGAMGTILTTAVTNIVKNGADATAEVAAAAEQCQAELDQVLA
jgi:multiple sugar transport system substrate-binding protein